MAKIHSIFILILLLSLAGNVAGASLHKAAKKGDLDRVKRLLDRGRDVNAKSSSGGTPLHEAALNGHKEIVELLLSKGADIDARNIYGRTPLHHAVMYDHKEVVKLLLSRGADPNVKNKWGGTPLHEATRQGHQEIVGLLENYSKKYNAKLRFRKKRIKAQETLQSNLPLIQTEEKKGDQAKKAGHHKKALSHYLAALDLTPPGTAMDIRLRKKTISFVRSLKPKPSIPAEAKRHAIRGQAFLELAKSKKGYQKALTEFQKAVQLAPWWASGYFNLALVQEKAEDFEGAIRNFRLYLIANPNARDKASIEKKIIKLEVANELKGK